MFRVIHRERRGTTILRHPLLPCLAPYHTINLTNGCPNRCVYCYAQSYDHHPGWGTVIFYKNTLELLKDELPRKRKKPVMVYFSTASEPFLPVPEILEHTFEIMRLLLENGIFLLISTKSVIPDRFVDLFRKNPGKAYIQVGLTTLDDGIRELVEPRAAEIRERLNNLDRLIKAGVSCEPRMDPLIPGLTDSLDSFMELMEGLQRIRVKSAAASFLFMRKGLDPMKRLVYKDWDFMTMARRIFTHKVSNYCGHGVIWIPEQKYRREKYALLRDVASAHGIDVHLCRCKNSDVTKECCHPLPDNSEETQLNFL